uniref:Superoxide dismutase copper/zinc binding domain-containing protein n=1 Tax=Sinocyclocheilus grahami TaxID=75366 RepID=A0A672TCA5_SINGR
MSTTIPSAQRLTVTRAVVCQVRFSQVSPQGPTILNISFTGLNARAGGYHIHILPIKSAQEPCSDTNIMGHFNPFSVNTASSPAPRNGTVDQYEIGDISGKFGGLTGQNNFQNQDMDGNMPLSGPNSIIGRSLVIHYTEIILSQMNNCSQVRALSCLVGHLTGRHGSISLTRRQLYNDILLQLAGDFTGSTCE